MPIDFRAFHDLHEVFAPRSTLIDVHEFLSPPESQQALSGVTPTLDMTTNVQTAINYCIANQSGLLIRGHTLTRQLTIDGDSPLSIVGPAPNRQIDYVPSNNYGGVMELMAGANGSLFKVQATAAAPYFAALYMRGNRSLQTDESYAIKFANSTTAARFAGTVFLCRMEFFRDGGIYCGLNRNVLRLLHSTIFYFGLTGIVDDARGVYFFSSFDNKIDTCGIGSGVGSGIVMAGGDGLRVTNTDLFQNTRSGFRATSGAQYYKLSGVKFDLNQQEQVHTEGTMLDNAKPAPHIIESCNFHGGNLNPNANTWSCIEAFGEYGLQVIDPIFESQDYPGDDTKVQSPIYLINFGGDPSKNVVWTGAKYNLDFRRGVSGPVNVDTVVVGNPLTLTVDTDPTTEYVVNAYVHANSPSFPGNWLFGRVTATTSTTVTFVLLAKNGTGSVSDFFLYTRRQFVREVTSDRTILVADSNDSNKSQGANSIWYRNIRSTKYQGSLDYTINGRTRYGTYIHNTALGVDRTVTLGTGGLLDGDEILFVRTATSTGAFNLIVGGLTNLGTSQWCRVRWDGTVWVLVERGQFVQGFDADTLDGHDSTYFLAASALNKTNIDALDVDADTLDLHDSTGFVQCPVVQFKTRSVYSGITTFDAGGLMTLAHGVSAGNKIGAVSARWLNDLGDGRFHFATVTGWDDTNVYLDAGTVSASGRTTTLTIIHEA